MAKQSKLSSSETLLAWTWTWISFAKIRELLQGYCRKFMNSNVTGTNSLLKNTVIKRLRFVSTMSYVLLASQNDPFLIVFHLLKIFRKKCITWLQKDSGYVNGFNDQCLVTFSDQCSHWNASTNWTSFLIHWWPKRLAKHGDINNRFECLWEIWKRRWQM